MKRSDFLKGLFTLPFAAKVIEEKEAAPEPRPEPEPPIRQFDLHDSTAEPATRWQVSSFSTGSW